jgi:transcriptional regulator with XRE-family HTH domain
VPKPANPALYERRLEFGRRLRELREERQLSQEELSRRAGLERKAVQRIETAVVIPSLDRILEVADALGVTPACFFMGKDDPATDGPCTG